MIQIKQFLLILCAFSSAWSFADEWQTMGRLSQLVDSQCRHFYGVDSNSPIEELKKKAMSEGDKLACAYPVAFKKVDARLKTLEALDPQSPWGAQARVTLAARIYNFDYLSDTPRGGVKVEIFGVHPDLMILHRILRQVTPYALAFVDPKLGDRGFISEARSASAFTEELTPWSATLKVASGIDCFGPQKAECLRARLNNFKTLVQAIQILKLNPNLFGAVAGYSQTLDAKDLRTAPAVQLAFDIQNAVAGHPVDYLMSANSSAAWWNVRPDLRDTLDYLDKNDSDLEQPVNSIINLQPLNCHVIYEAFAGLAAEDRTNLLRGELMAINPMGATEMGPIDGFKMREQIDARSCADLPALGRKLNLHGLLSRFEAYQIHLLLMTSHPNDSLPAALRPLSKRHALLLDIENVIKQVQAKGSNPNVDETPTPEAQKLVDYIQNLLKGDK